VKAYGRLVLLIAGIFCALAQTVWGSETEVKTAAPAGNSAVAVQSAAISEKGNSVSAKADEQYEENSWFEDFEVHFLVSLPFTALYSYMAVTTLDGLVQGKYPTAFRLADMWVVAGLALGSSMAVALGSINRVPDQSVPRMAEQQDVPDEMTAEVPLWRLALIRIDY
jgi:hypothetical protein